MECAIGVDALETLARELINPYGLFELDLERPSFLVQETR
jgi:hypothetical protein